MSESKTLPDHPAEAEDQAPQGVPNLGGGSDEAVTIPDVLPVLPLRDTVVFPYIILPLSISRDRSVAAVDHALANHRIIFLVTQKDGTQEDPEADDLHTLGTAGIIMRMLKLPDGRIRILVQGLARARIEHLGQTEPFLQASVERVGPPPPERVLEPLEVEALIRSVKESLDQATTLGKSISPEVMVIATNLEDPGRLADLAASNLELKTGEAQRILETLDPITRLQAVGAVLQREVQILTMQQEISSQARGEMDRTQREYFLRQQLKAIQQELGEGEELSEEVETYRRKARESGMSEEAVEELERQIRRLERSHPDSAESSIIRTYLDWLTGLPWNTTSEDNLELDHAQQVLDEDHYDLEKIKERIIEYLAVRQLKSDTRGPILCFVGPPGVGKTSLGRSIARAIGRQFVRISLGGVRDEAEIRGHRRTYVGALPGRIIQGIHQAGTSNPVFMLDEIDKVGSDYRGDPSSALLEVLDPEQNTSFRDHYLGVEYDLSRVLFIATANLLDPIQPAFRDRMEVLRLSGYTDAEKLHIAHQHLIPKQLEAHGLTDQHLVLTDPALEALISSYTKEAGLRNLERELAAICRKVAVRVARARREEREEREEGTGRPTEEGGTEREGTEPEEPTEAQPAPAPVETLEVTPYHLTELLGPARHFSEELLDRDRVGVATGLAWTAAGGDLMFIEVVAVPGSGKLLLTGQLGEVMKESAQAALSFARAWAAEHPEMARLEGFPAERDLHVHVPAGSIPKDGPSAGITVATAVLSVLTGRPVDRRIAMTGEITLRGDVMPIGGLKEKVLAAKGAGVSRVVLPRLNQRDLEDIQPPLKAGLEFHLVEHVEQVLALALLPTVVADRMGAMGAARKARSPSAKGRRKSPKTSKTGKTSKTTKADRKPAP